MELKDIIKSYKEKTGLTDQEIADACGVTRSTVVRWGNGFIQRVNGDTARKISTLVGYDIEPLLKGYETQPTLPVLGYVKAGYDLFAEENYLGEEDATLQEKRGADYYLKVTGDSMTGVGIMPGSLVLVQQTSDVESGSIGVVMIGDEVTVKRIIKKRGLLVLEAANASVPSRFYNRQDIQNLPVKIIGKVISVKTYF